MASQTLCRFTCDAPGCKSTCQPAGERDAWQKLRDWGWVVAEQPLTDDDKEQGVQMKENLHYCPAHKAKPSKTLDIKVTVTEDDGDE